MKTSLPPPPPTTTVTLHLQEYSSTNLQVTVGLPASPNWSFGDQELYEVPSSTMPTATVYGPAYNLG